MVDDLHALLRTAGIPPPFVLVGHSAGGLQMRLYAAHHPEEVAGLVLVDSSHPHQQRRLRQRDLWRYSRPKWWLRTAKIALCPLGLARLRDHLHARREGRTDVPRGIPPELAEMVTAIRRSSRQRRGDVKEMLAFPRFAAEVSRAVSDTPGSLEQLPLTVISRAVKIAETPWPAHLEVVWQDLQAELASLSKDAIHLHAQTGDHYIHRADPDLVVQAIVDMVNRIRARDP